MKFSIKKILIAATLVACGASHAPAQSDAQFSQYYAVPTYYNPAAVGQTDYLSIRGGTRLQWVGIHGAPKSFAVTADMPFKFIGKRWGVGLVAAEESIGLYRTMNLDAQLGFKLKKWGGTFTAAVQVGMYDQSFKGTEVVLPDNDDYHQGTDDGIPTQDLHGTALDVGAGVWYEHRHWWAGISANHVTEPSVTLDTKGETASTSENIYEYKVGRTVYFMAGGNIPVKNTLFEVMPSVFVKSDFNFWTAEATLRARYNKVFSFGVGYRYNDAVYATIAAELKNFYVGYSYDYPVTDISKASSGSHEIFVGYRMKLNLGDKNRNRHKSIRIM